MVSHGSGIDQRRPPVAVPAPPGATLAGFTLFAALAALLAMLYAASEWWNLAGSFGFPTDAAWARAVFARNLAAGKGLCFNAGTPAAGAPGSSWIAALALVGFFTGKFLVTAKALGLLAVILTSYLVWHTTVNLLGDWRFAFLAGLLVAASPRLTAQGLSGTEAAWAALMVMAAIHWHAVGWNGTVAQRALGAVAIGLAALSRPELILLLPLLLIDRWFTSLAHDNPGERLRGGVLRSIPEFAGAAAVVAPFLVYNLRSGGPLWQQPEFSLRLPALWAWAGTALDGLWADNPVLFLAALFGCPVVLASMVRLRSPHPSFLIALIPPVILFAPALIWRQASAENGLFTAAYLTPLVAILAAAGLFLAHRGARQLLSPEQAPARRRAFGAGIALTCALVFGLLAANHPRTWRDYGFQVKKVSDLQGFLGRWAADHLAADASIASREVGAIGFFSSRRMLDLGGTISQQGLEYLSRPGSPDSNLLAYLQKTRPSHLAIRPSDFPDLSQRPDLLTPAVTCVVTDPFTGGVTTMALYETPWPPLSVMEARAQAGRR
ncbi:MAG TPA: hypothetical protein VMY87_02750 [Armatimonadota bacterium]|nr:hypothetical protein [Armatimonadota bacterium]